MDTEQSCCVSQKNNREPVSQIIHNYYSAVAVGSGPYAEGTNKFSPSAPTDRIVQYVKESGKERILDLGCGMGTTLLRLVQEHSEGKQFIGVDFTQSMIERAREESKKLPPDLKKKVGFFEGDLQQLPYLDKQFDFVYSECVFNLVPNREKAVQEVSRVLNQNGVFAYTDFVSFVPMREDILENQELICGCRTGSITLSENIKLLEKCGFKNIQCFDFTEDKNKRDQELQASSDKIKEDFEKYYEENPEAAKFLDEKVGYYLILGIKN